LRETLVSQSRWSVSKLAREFNTTRQNLADKIKRANVQPTGTENGNSVYALADVAAIFFADQIVVAGSANFDPDKLPPTDRKAWYESEKVRLHVEREQGQLVTLDEYQEELARVFKELANFLETLPDTLERKCTLQPVVVETMQKLIDEQREMLATRICDTLAE
jgi:hypothetical protein